MVGVWREVRKEGGKREGEGEKVGSNNDVVMKDTSHCPKTKSLCLCISHDRTPPQRQQKRGAKLCDNQKKKFKTYPPKPPHALIQPRRKNIIHIAKHTSHISPTTFSSCTSPSPSRSPSPTSSRSNTSFDSQLPS